MRSITVMVVDDSNIIRGKISRISDSTDRFEIVSTATNGIDALSKYRKLRPQVVTMDLTMPHMDGIECISNLITINPRVRILVVSALSDEATGIEALENGAAGFLLKPFSDAQLTEALGDLTEDLDV